MGFDDSSPLAANASWIIRMGAPGLAFETWDPPSKCRRNRAFTVRAFSRAEFSNLFPGICVEDPRSQKRDLGHPSSYSGDHADLLVLCER